MLSLFMVACSNDEELVKNEEKGIEVIPAEIIQPCGDNSTRVVIGGEPGDGSRPIMWRADDPKTSKSEADVIYVYDSEGNGASFIYSENEDGTSGVFIKDKKNKKAQVVKDVSSALCVSCALEKRSYLPGGVDKEFKFSSMLFHRRGAENAQMYGFMEDGILKFKPTTGILELVIQNDDEIKKAAKDNYKATQFIITLEAYNENGEKVIIGGGKGKIDPATESLEIIDGEPKLDLAVRDFGAIGNTYYFPLIPGEYSKFELTLRPASVRKAPMSEVFTITAKEGTLMKVEKKLYTIKPTFKLL